MNKQHIYVELEKNHYDLFCPICGQKSIGLEEVKPCRHMMFYRIGEEVGYIAPEIEKEYNRAVQNFEKKIKSGEKNITEPEIDHILENLQSLNFLSITYEQKSVLPMAYCDVHIIYKTTCTPKKLATVKIF